MIYQGSNLPVLIRNFPVVPKDISVTINVNGNEIKHWGLEDVRIGDGYIICPLTQEETLSFPKGMCVITVKMTDQNGAICCPVEIPTYIVGRKDMTILEGEEAQYSSVIDYDLAEIEAETGKIIIKVDVKKEDIDKALGYTPYGKPETGIPETDLSDEVQTKLNQHGGGGDVTKEAIETALGYTPADTQKVVAKETGKGLSTNDYSNDDKAKVDNLPTNTKEEIRKLIPKPTDAPVVGKILKVKSVNDDGTFVCEWADAPQGGVEDVQINGTSITENGVANIPIATSKNRDILGLVKSGGIGISIPDNGAIYIVNAPISNIKNRMIADPITCSNYDQAVKHALCDEATGTGDEMKKPLSWTPEEQSNAQARLGIFPMNEEGYGYGR